MKKFLAVAAVTILTGTCMVLPESGMTPGLTASAYTKGTYGGMSYVMYDTYVNIYDFDNSISTVTIPAEISGIPVTTISANAFENATQLKSLKISEGVTEIASFAFYKCTSLEEVTLPDTLQTIGQGAFQNCISLAEIEIPASVDTIGWSAFKDCVNLQELIIPDGVNSIGDSLAYGCTNLRTVDIGDGPVEIPNEAFENCTSLKTVYIPLSITKIYGSSSFSNCPLQDVYYAGSMTQWNAVYGKEYISATIHCGTEELPEPLTPDLNGDGIINSVDAADILQYAAYAGSGGTDDLATFLKKRS